MTTRTIIGIDPGQIGGIAIVGPDMLDAVKMPDTERDVFELLAEWAPLASRAVIEQVGVMPKEGVRSAFTFGRGYGGLRMALIALRMPFQAVAPGVWQRPFNLPTGKGGKTAKKNVHKARAQEMFPSLKITHAIADALLIAEWGRRCVLEARDE